MCKDSASKKMIIGAVGEAAIKKEITLLQYQFPDKEITALDVCREGNVYDLGIDIDHKLYRGQVKTTERCDKNGAMIFQTSRRTLDENKNSHLQLYKKGDIDFFFLYCIEKDWAGLALPGECKTKIKVYLTGTRSSTAKMACDMEFRKRMRELLETNNISLLLSEQRLIKKQTESDSKLTPVFKKPASWEEFFNLLVEYNHDLEQIAEAKHISLATLEKWHHDFCYLT